MKLVYLYISTPLEETKGRPALERRTGGGSVSSKNAGLRRSMEVHSCFPRMSRRNAFGRRWRNLYGPV